MEKIVTETEMKEVTTRYHEFYCDRCKKLLGKFPEFDDGYYAKPQEIEMDFTISVGTRKFKRYSSDHNLCEDCQEKFFKEVEEMMEEAGFAYTVGGKKND